MPEFQKLVNLEQAVGLADNTKIQVDGKVKAFTYGRIAQSTDFGYAAFLQGVNPTEILIHGRADIIDLPLLKRSNETGKTVKIQGEVYKLKKRAPFLPATAIKITGFKFGDYASRGWVKE